MKLSEFNLDDFRTSPFDYDKHNTYQRLLVELWEDGADEDEDDPISSFDMYFEAAFVEDNEVQMLKVNAEDFKMGMQDLKNTDSENAVVKFFYEDGSNNGIFNKIPLKIAAYVKERNAIYFEADEE